MTEFEYNYENNKDRLGIDEDWSKFAYYIYREWHYLPSEFIKSYD